MIRGASGRAGVVLLVAGWLVGYWSGGQGPVQAPQIAFAQSGAGEPSVVYAARTVAPSVGSVRRGARGLGSG
jgi:hypothetical protein